jgi:branched-chain amino acid transport system permease protein
MTSKSLTPAKQFAATVEHLAADFLSRIADPEQVVKATGRLALAVRAAGVANPKVYECTPASVAQAVAMSALTGLMPGGPKPEVYLIPRSGKLEWQISARGLQALAGMIWGGDNRGFPAPSSNSGIEFAGRIWPFSVYDVLVIVITALLVIGLTVMFTRTNLGLSMRASAFNPEVARLSGVRVSRMLAFGWVLAGMVGAVAGVLIAPSATVSPNSFDILLVFAFTAAVIGGLDSLVGAVALGVGTGLVISLVSGFSDSSNAPVVALVLLALNLLLKPDGVFGHHKARTV